MASQSDDLSRVLAEFHMGTAMAAAFIFHVLEKKGVLSTDEISRAIRDASEQIPDDYAGEPRFAGLVALRVLLDDPEMRHTTPFPWKPGTS